MKQPVTLHAPLLLKCCYFLHIKCIYNFIISCLTYDLGARALCSHVACTFHGVKDLCPVRYLPGGLCGGGGGLSPGVVCPGDSESSRGDQHPGAARGEETGGASRRGRDPGAEPERQIRVHPESGPEQEPLRKKLTFSSWSDVMNTNKKPHSAVAITPGPDRSACVSVLHLCSS